MLRITGWTFVLAFALTLADVLLGFRLPQPLRAAVPWLLIATSVLGITLLVGALGTPKRPPPSDRATRSA